MYVDGDFLINRWCIQGRLVGLCQSGYDQSFGLSREDIAHIVDVCVYVGGNCWEMAAEMVRTRVHLFFQV